MASEFEQSQSEGGSSVLDELAVGREIDGIQLQEAVARSRFKRTFKGWSVEDASFVAIKFYRTEAGQDSSDENFLDRIVEQINRFNGIEDEGLLHIADVGVYEELIYTVTEWLEGGNLAKRLEERDGELLGRADELVLRLCRTLDRCHRVEVVHGNLKATNVLFDGNGRPRLTDFTVPLLSHSQERNGEAGGYLAPELREAPQQQTPRCDVFSLGTIAYELLTGREFRFSSFELPSRGGENVDPGWDPIIERATRFGPGRRYSSAVELLSELIEVAGPPPQQVTVVLHCPECNAETPADSLTCQQCMADLADLFEACPDCQRMTPMLHPRCIHCGRSRDENEPTPEPAQGLRPTPIPTQTATTAETLEPQPPVEHTPIPQTPPPPKKRSRGASRSGVLRAEAAAFEEEGDYEEALARMHELARVQGEPFLQTKQQAEEQIDQLRSTITQELNRRVAEVRSLLDEGRINQALDIVDTMPPEDERINELMELIEQKMQAAQEALEGAVDAALAGQKKQTKSLATQARRLWSDCRMIEVVVAQIPEIYTDTHQHELRELLDQAVHAISEDQFKTAREHIEKAVTIDPDSERVRRITSRFKHQRVVRGFLCNLMEGKRLYFEGDTEEAMNALLEASRWLPSGSESRELLTELLRAVAQEQLEVDRDELMEQWKRIRPYGTAVPESIEEQVHDNRPEGTSGTDGEELGEEETEEADEVEEKEEVESGDVRFVTAEDLMDEDEVEQEQQKKLEKDKEQEEQEDKQKEKRPVRWYDVAIFVVALLGLLIALAWLFLN